MIISSEDQPTSAVCDNPSLIELLSRPPLQGGAQGRNRTTDTAIFSRMLYQLSYLGE